MPLNSTNLDVIHQAFANIRLESLELSEQMKNMISKFTLEGSITTTEILETLIKG